MRANCSAALNVLALQTATKATKAFLRVRKRHQTQSQHAGTRPTNRATRSTNPKALGYQIAHGCLAHSAGYTERDEDGGEVEFCSQHEYVPPVVFSIIAVYRSNQSDSEYSTHQPQCRLTFEVSHPGKRDVYPMEYCYGTAAWPTVCDDDLSPR